MLPLSRSFGCVTEMYIVDRIFFFQKKEQKYFFEPVVDSLMRSLFYVMYKVLVRRAASEKKIDNFPFEL
jgi:uncharacterized protein YktA (UPF0223 family)